jgi:hypothetical protein
LAEKLACPIGGPFNPNIEQIAAAAAATAAKKLWYVLFFRSKKFFFLLLLRSGHGEMASLPPLQSFKSVSPSLFILGRLFTEIF